MTADPPGTTEPTCQHCGALVSAAAAVWDDQTPYCCTGCRAVASIIKAGGLEQYYQKREGFSPRPRLLDTRAFDADAFQASHVRARPDGRREVELVVDGVRCSACTWLIERAVGQVPGVDQVHVSYATHRAHLVWDPTETPLSAVAARIAELGYRPLVAGEARRFDHDLVARLGVAAFCAMNAMLFSVALYAGWFQGIAERHAELMRWAGLLIATPAVFYSSAPFFDRAWAALRHRLLHMDVPIALAIAVMYVHGLAATLAGQDAYFDTLTMLVALLLSGRLLEQSGRSRAEHASSALLATAPTSARRLVAGRIEEVPAAELAVGDTILVGRGEALPVDGRIAAGHALVDLSLVTGESEGRQRAVGDTVPAGALLQEGNLEVVVEATGRETLLARMADWVSRARAERAPHLQLADRIAPWFTLAVLVVAGLTFAGWTLAAGLEAALPPTIAVLVVACPCALALGTPTALAAGLGAAARRGAYVRGGAVIERLARVDLAVLDKTGTLTEGQLAVSDADDEVLRLATGLERASHHPVARAILDEAARRRIPIAAGRDTVELPGVGIRGVVEGRQLAMRRAASGRVGLWEDDHHLVGTIAFGDRVRSDSPAALAELEVPAVMLTGDAESVAERVADELGGLPQLAGLLPLAKADWVAARRQEGRVVLFAGDGLNDAPALTAADVGMAMGTGSAASVLAADAVVLQPSIRPVAAALRAARLVKRTLVVNSVASISYNLVTVAAAAAGLVNPLVAAVLMPLSSLFVVLNALAIERRMDHGHRLRAAAALDGPGRPLRLAVREGGA